MHLERFKKVSTAVMRYEELENQIREIDHMATITANANITASFNLHVHEPEREQETREAGAFAIPQGPINGLMAALAQGGMPGKCRCCHDIGQILNEAGVLKILAVLLTDRREKQLEVERELMGYGITL